MGTLADDYIAARKEAERPKRRQQTRRPIGEYLQDAEAARQAILPATGDTLARMALGAGRDISRGISTLVTTPLPGANPRQRFLADQGAQARARENEVVVTAPRAPLSRRAAVAVQDAWREQGGLMAPARIAAQGFNAAKGFVKSAVVDPAVNAPRDFMEGGRLLRENGYEAARPRLAASTGNAVLTAGNIATLGELGALRGVAGAARAGAREAVEAAPQATAQAARGEAGALDMSTEARRAGPMGRSPRRDTLSLPLAVGGGLLGASLTDGDARAQGRGVGDPRNNVDERPMSREELMARGGGGNPYPPPSYVDGFRGREPPRPDPNATPMEQLAPGGPYYPGGGREGERNDSGGGSFLPFAAAAAMGLAGRYGGRALAAGEVAAAERLLAKAPIRQLEQASRTAQAARNAQETVANVFAGTGGALGGLGAAAMDPSIASEDPLSAGVKYGLGGAAAGLAAGQASRIARPATQSVLGPRTVTAEQLMPGGRNPYRMRPPELESPAAGRGGTAWTSDVVAPTTYGAPWTKDKNGKLVQVPQWPLTTPPPVAGPVQRLPPRGDQAFMLPRTAEGLPFNAWDGRSQALAQGRTAMGADRAPPRLTTPPRLAPPVRPPRALGKKGATLAQRIDAGKPTAPHFKSKEYTAAEVRQAAQLIGADVGKNKGETAANIAARLKKSDGKELARRLAGAGLAGLTIAALPRDEQGESRNVR